MIDIPIITRCIDCRKSIRADLMYSDIQTHYPDYVGHCIQNLIPDTQCATCGGLMINDYFDDLRWLAATGDKGAQEALDGCKAMFPDD